MGIGLKGTQSVKRGLGLNGMYQHKIEYWDPKTMISKTPFVTDTKVMNLGGENKLVLVG